MNRTDYKICQCLCCPIGHQMISEYFELFSKLSSNNEFSDDVKPNIDYISDCLGIHGSYKERCEYIKSLPSVQMSQTKAYKTVHNLTEKKDCIKILHDILMSISFLLTGDNPNSVIDYSKIITKKNTSVLFYMNKSVTDAESLLLDNDDSRIIQAAYKKYNKIAKEIEVMANRIGKVNSGEEKKQIRQKIAKLRRTLHHNYYYILKQYCSNKINYHFCNPDYAENGQKYINCKADYFYAISKDLKSYNCLDYNRIKNIKSEYQTIIYQYLTKAPKNFGAILSFIMDYEGITEQDIVNLWGIPVSKIQQYKNNESNPLTKDKLKELGRILLVSEDFLICGAGVNYGNWGIVLNHLRESNEELMSEETKEFIKLLNDSGHYNYAKTITALRKAVQEDIKNLIQLSEDDFNKIITDNPDFFYNDEICVFTNIEDGELYYDYQAMYDNLLHPEEFDVLLSILEKPQPKEEQSNHD